METVKIQLKDRVLKLKYDSLNDSIDVSEFLKIQHHNLVGEAITFSVLYNMIGIWKSEAEDYERTCKMDLDIFCSRERESQRRSILKEKGKKGTEKEVEDAVMITPEYEDVRKKYIKSQKATEDLSALVWAAQSKSKKIDILSQKLVPSDALESILEGTINGVMISSRKHSIAE